MKIMNILIIAERGPGEAQIALQHRPIIKSSIGIVGNLKKEIIIRSIYEKHQVFSKKNIK